MIVAEKSAELSVEGLAKTSVGDSIVLHGVSWATYQALRAPEENGHLRMTFDDGDLEIMSPQKKHGRIASLLDHMIYEWTRLHSIEIESGRDMTCDREDLAKGLEPDLCYWIANQPRVHGRDEIDFQHDPPPDLALEVDVTRTSIPKLPIYAALRIPEVWCWRKGLKILRLDAAGQFAASDESGVLPGFPLRVVAEFIDRRNTIGETRLMAEFATTIAALPGPR